ncbi:unnamed protein product [Bemisia tabaci]|uniref:Uncharacterized protein n=1 Tax=Bemisia tabaci TaxID=7038 RepID=A0A9P0F8L5_BEMTA|nr:unnamed protein product [Bemisia tabaci]
MMGDDVQQDILRFYLDAALREAMAAEQNAWPEAKCLPKIAKYATQLTNYTNEQNQIKCWTALMKKNAGIYLKLVNPHPVSQFSDSNVKPSSLSAMPTVCVRYRLNVVNLWLLVSELAVVLQSNSQVFSVDCQIAAHPFLSAAPV